MINCTLTSVKRMYRADPVAGYRPAQSPDATLVSYGGTYDHTFEMLGVHLRVYPPR